MKKLFAVFFVLFAICSVSTPAMAAGSVSVYANPHNNGQGGHGAGMSVAMQATDSVDVSLNYLDTNARHGGSKIFYAGVGTSMPVTSNLSAVAEVGFGAVHKGDSNVVPVALGLKYAVADKMSLLAKGTRYFKDESNGNKENIQWTVGAALEF